MPNMKSKETSASSLVNFYTPPSALFPCAGLDQERREEVRNENAGLSFLQLPRRHVQPQVR